MHTADDPSIPTFSYVGRLRDSRKGLEVFLDALAILLEGDSSKCFRAWIIGGSPEDKAWAIRLAGCRHSLANHLSSGELVFWGRIDSSALPEFYSRSTALVVPSFREQFCITAVEAMMCGCPVIAANVGGLRDVIVDGRTGHLFERGQSTSLAGVMAAYITNPLLARWLGENAAEWAHHSYEARAIHDALFALLRQPFGNTPSQWEGTSESRFRQHAIRRTLPTVERLLDTKVISWDDLTSSQSISFRADLNDHRKVFVKMYSDRPTYLSCIHKMKFPGDPRQLPRERLEVALRLRGQDFFPAVLAFDSDAGLIIQEWVDPLNSASESEIRDAMLKAASLMASFDPVPESLEIRRAIYRTLGASGEVSLEALEQIDGQVAETHIWLGGGSKRARRAHPQLELLRILQTIELNTHWMPRDYVTRTQAVLPLLLTAKPIIPAMPTFAHGTLKEEHLLSMRPLICDFDHAGYYCGPVDLAHWLWDSYSRLHGSHPGRLLRALRDELPDPVDLYLGTSWILAFQLNRDLVFLSRGDRSRASATLGFLYEFGEALRGLALLRD